MPLSRALATLIALALLATGLLLVSRPPGSSSILADSHGRIEQVVLSVSSARSSTLRNALLSSSIVNALPEYVQILILAPDREAFTVVSNPWPERVRFADMPENHQLTIWPQDPFLVLDGADGPRLLASPGFERAEDSKMARAVARQLGLPLETAGLRFEGGNIVADREHVFIGANTIRHNALRLREDEREIARRFGEALNKKVVVIGPAPQPVGHIDMMLTPLGDARLLLADPAWGARLARGELESNAGAVADFERRCERNFFGHADITEVTTSDGEILRAPRIVGTTAEAIADSDAIAADIDRLAVTLAELGFEIVRIPFLFRKPAPAELPAPGRTIPSRPGYPVLTYNNALLETSESTRRVYLPTYGWQALDDAGAAVWQTLGYEVRRIPGFETSAMYGGALRCSVKVLRRTYN